MESSTPPPRTIKVVILGDSGVGKTSLRNQYIYGRFSTGYRATIGTDFISKTLPHHSNSQELVTLQIWDTAGQERFAGLSAAFFRGADAVICAYDVNKPETLQGVKRWWQQFRERAPVVEGEEANYCCVVVGNKTDLSPLDASGSRTSAVSESDARRLMQELIPTLPEPEPEPSGVLRRATLLESPDDTATLHPISAERNGAARPTTPQTDSDNETDRPPKSRSPSINIARPYIASPSRGTSRSRMVGTMTTINTTISVYHTPSSSLFSQFNSPPSSPPRPAPISRTDSSTSISDAMTSSTVTVTPPKPLETATPDSLPPTPPRSSSPPPDVGPKFFFSSARTGACVSDIFEYIARRVVTRWEWEERMEERMLAVRSDEEDGATIKLSQGKGSRWREACCS